MKSTGAQFPGFLLLAVVLAGTVIQGWSSGAPANPYQVITERNAFGLSAPSQEPIVQPPPVEKPIPTVRLAGITSILPQKLALLEISEAAGKPVTRMILAEGDHDGGIELVAVDMDRNRVTIRQGSALTNLILGAVKSPYKAAPPRAPIH